ncbi:Htur_1727 family rSAM-partnered candidate RiPP [Haloparvum sedimenti]|uniref:Htur_1727 family rSAM-partnered candidate RiPP n=1 Tax=Haloparvum sedimenti TaxID=1678448 RepID=UPI00071E7A42|nr:Htur_1727 family rSAM-partnered candidate RiPP [Haloparvum sedimenti]
MVEKATRTEEAAPRATTERRFEVFVREAADEPLEHVGTVAAPDPDTAHEEAGKLFAWYARDVWVCPSGETHRYSTYSLAGEGDEVEADSGGDSDDRAPPEPRVYEETEGTPEVGDGA